MTRPVSDIFDVRYGHSLELNALEPANAGEGVAFVSRQMGNNGISAFVAPVSDLEPAPAGDISCALGGNGVLTTYVQEAEFYCGRDVAVLRPKTPLTKQEIIYYCMCIKANRYRFNYGRQANKTLSKLLVPSADEIPDWVNKANLDKLAGMRDALDPATAPKLTDRKWAEFTYSALFDIERGKGPRKSTLTETGSTPFITSTDRNNGLTGYTPQSPHHAGNVITVNRNGSVAEAFYQPSPFATTEDVHVFAPKFDLSKYIAMFLTPLIRMEKYRFSYGRKWGLARMNASLIRLPVTAKGDPDWAFMEAYIKSLPYSKSI